MASRRRSDRARGALRVAAGVGLWWATGAATAFTLSDGTTVACVADGRKVIEIDAPEDSDFNARGYTGFTGRTGAGYSIVWNVKKRDSLPPAMHDFIFYHECAHARVPTREEWRANCEGLKAMRADGRAGFAVEAKLAAFYGPASEYWAQTLKCANEPAPAAR
jgi:hypothetical protein